MAPPTDDPAFRDLARELYWVRDGDARGLMDVAEVRDRLHDLWAQMRSDERAVIPVGETNLGSPTKVRRRLKYVLWRALRPVSWRYDRLIGDHAELTTALADRVLALEAEVRRLEALIANRGDEQP
jgi:hypothetical protein